MSKHTILFLAANPLGTDRLALDEEARAIQEELERSGHRDQFELVTRWAVRPLDLLRALRKLKPTVVHFSGHGGHGEAGDPRSSAGPHRDIVGKPGAVGGNAIDGDDQHGLFFQGPDGRTQLVSAAALEKTFGAAGASVKLVILNACYSEVQAEALRAHVECVLGMGGSISDDAARSFAIGFYGGLGERESIATAYRQGCVAISLDGLRDSERPQLRLRDGVDAERLYFTDVPAAARPSRRSLPVSRVSLALVTACATIILIFVSHFYNRQLDMTPEILPISVPPPATDARGTIDDATERTDVPRDAQAKSSGFRAHSSSQCVELLRERARQEVQQRRYPRPCTVGRYPLPEDQDMCEMAHRVMEQLAELMAKEGCQ